MLHLNKSKYSGQVYSQSSEGEGYQKKIFIYILEISPKLSHIQNSRFILYYYYLFIQLYDNTTRYNMPHGAAKKYQVLGEKKLQYLGLNNIVKLFLLGLRFVSAVSLLSSFSAV